MFLEQNITVLKLSQQLLSTEEPKLVFKMQSYIDKRKKKMYAYRLFNIIRKFKKIIPEELQCQPMLLSS